MGIYLPNMNMPISCHVCVAEYGGCCYVAPSSSDGICPDSGRPEWCPLVEAPQSVYDMLVLALDNDIVNGNKKAKSGGR